MRECTVDRYGGLGVDNGETRALSVYPQLNHDCGSTVHMASCRFGFLLGRFDDDFGAVASDMQMNRNEIGVISN